MANEKYQLISESQLLRQFNIPDFRHLTKDHVLELASSIHKLDPEVAKKVIEQFPEFSKSALEGLTDFKETTIDVLNREDRSTKDFIEVCNREIDILESCISEDLNFDQKIEILDRIDSVRESVSEHTKEKRRFHFGTIIASVVTVLGAIGILAQALGGNTNIQNPIADSSNDRKLIPSNTAYNRNGQNQNRKY